MSWLFLDSSRPDAFRIGTFGPGRVSVKTVCGRSHKLLPALERLIRTPQALGDSDGICVVHGPGSFSSVRGGVLAANLLARHFRKPLVGVSVSDAEDLPRLADALVSNRLAPSSYVMPTYTAEPNITVCHP